MQSLQSFAKAAINESVQNFFEHDIVQKKKYAQQVWDILQEAYKSQGGIKGNGFNSIDDMLNIPFWKLDIVDEQVVCVFMYKFKKESPSDGNLRKLVALGISRQHADVARKKMSNILKQEFSRSILEISGLMLDYVEKKFPEELKKYLMTAEDAMKVLPNDDIVPIDKFKYNRMIGGHYHEKIMLGSKVERY